MCATVNRGAMGLPLLACNYLLTVLSNSHKAALSSVKAVALSQNRNGHLGIPQHHFDLYHASTLLAG